MYVSMFGVVDVLNAMSWHFHALAILKNAFLSSISSNVLFTSGGNSYR